MLIRSEIFASFPGNLSGAFRATFPALSRPAEKDETQTGLAENTGQNKKTSLLGGSLPVPENTYCHLGQIRSIVLAMFNTLQIRDLSDDDRADILLTIRRIAAGQGEEVQTLAQALAYARQDEQALEYLGQYIDID